MTQLPLPPRELFKICKIPLYETQFKEILQQYIITEHYFLYIRSKHLFDFNKNIEKTFNLYYGENSLLNIQKTIEYHTVCDYLLGKQLPNTSVDPMIFSFAKKFVAYFKAVNDTIAEINLQIKNITVVFYFQDFLEYTFRGSDDQKR